MIAEMPKRGENIRKRRDGRWEARYIKGYQPNGKAVYASVYAKTYAEVKQMRQEKLFLGTDSLKACKINVQQLFELWMAKMEIRVKRSTYAKYDTLIRNHIVPRIGGMKLNKLTADMVDAFIVEKSKKGRLDGKGGLSPKTVKDIASLLQMALRFAAAEKLMPPMRCPITQPQVVQKEIRVLTKEEQDRLESYIIRHLDPMSVGILICLYTGIRLGELCALKWEDISLNTGFIRIHRTMMRIKDMEPGALHKTKILIDTPKSRSSVREIPLPTFLLEILRDLQGEVSDEAFLLTGQQNKYVEPRTYENKFYSYLKQSGLPHTNFHALRHTFATRCIENNFDVKSLSEILGHSSVNITLNRYVHSSADLKKSHMERLYPHSLQRTGSEYSLPDAPRQENGRMLKIG